MKRVLIRSADGSNTLKLTEYDEAYHSMNGALAESNHIYIGCGLVYYSNNFFSENILDLQHTKEINIFEVGLGTGLNCLLSAIYALNHSDLRINYSGIEKYPITDEEFLSLNHLDSVLKQSGNYTVEDISKIRKINEQIHFSNWEKRTALLTNFTLEKFNSDLLDYKHGNEVNDIIYFDAFSPETQPEMWTKRVFEALYKSMKPGGILVTYSSKGVVKQALRETGFSISRLGGPLGKRHILRAVKPF